MEPPASTKLFCLCNIVSSSDKTLGGVVYFPGRTGGTKLFRFSKKGSADAESGGKEGFYLPANRRLGSSMTHRSDIVWIDAAKKKNEILSVIRDNPSVSLFPVCSGTVDSVLGVLSARAFLESLTLQSWPGLKSLVRKPVYLPETVTIARTLSMLAESDCGMAIIIDEYGGIEGIVTRNGLVGELLEEFVGEGGEDESDIFRRDDGSWLVGGQVRMDEIRPLVSLPDTDSRDYYTLAGYLLAVNGSIPKTGDRIQAGDWVCEIMDMDGHRIDKVLISASAGQSDSLAQAPEKA